MIELKGMEGKIFVQQTRSFSVVKEVDQEAAPIEVLISSRDSNLKGSVVMWMRLFSMVSLEVLKKGVEEDITTTLMGIT